MLNPNSVGGEAIPAVFSLNQNYPNPFNPSTVIKYQLAADNYTTLKVYNIIGKEVATLVNGNQTAGYHQVTFDAAQLSNGIYFYKLQSGNNVEVKKLTLVK
ncbi:MAG: T9SS type A sorting domain-containing protein [Bacteroidota bacterium]|nr:T9SS type A sorting domain-containing protein [Bacteroidota bacterium]